MWSSMMEWLPRRAWVWAVAMGVFAAGVAGASLHPKASKWWFDEATMYSTSTHEMVLGVLYAGAVVGAALYSRRWSGRRTMLAINVLWALSFPAWFSYATVQVCFGWFGAFPINDGLGGGTMLERMGSIAGMIVVAGAVTAVLAWRLTRSGRVAGWIAVASVAAALVQMIPVSADAQTPGAVALWSGYLPAPMWMLIVVTALVWEGARARRAPAGAAGDRGERCGAQAMVAAA